MKISYSYLEKFIEISHFGGLGEMITSPEKKAAKAKPMVSAMDFACLYSNILVCT